MTIADLPRETATARTEKEALLTAYARVREQTERLCEPLATEDYVVQSMKDVSPTKWHLAHTTWFFEVFLLEEYKPGYSPLNAEYHYLFNSYYNAKGERHCRAQRGYLSRPTVEEVFAYRKHVDAEMGDLLAAADDELIAALAPTLTIGLHHEQQHQELLVTDVKHVFSVNPLRPAYRQPERAGRGLDGVEEEAADSLPLEWVHFDEGLHWIGHDGDGFAFDNEGPQHRAFVQGFALGSRLVTSGEFLAFMEAGGYQKPEYWLSEGWAQVEAQGWSEPFYWERRDDEWWLYGLSGMRRVAAAEPVCHVNYFEADAYARWAGARLPTEQEWEVGAATVPVKGNFVESQRFHPAPAVAGEAEGQPLSQMYGDAWEWTRSSYEPYPGYSAAPGALGEYNGKFMCNQYVLRGGSCATPASHIRRTYRNFFSADASWQFMGIRLARDLG
jgi:ergothioneine biosynthesis protein EgtB